LARAWVAWRCGSRSGRRVERCALRSDTPTRFRAQSSTILPFISGLRRKGRLDLYSVTHWTEKRFTVTRRTPRRIRPGVRTAWTELQSRRKVLVLNEKQRTANQSNGLIFYQVVATGFEPATSRSRSVHTLMRSDVAKSDQAKTYANPIPYIVFPGFLEFFEDLLQFTADSLPRQRFIR